MKYAGLIKNDIAAGPGLCVSFYTQGCPHRCAGCHNPETWDFDGGLEFRPEVIEEIIKALTDRGLKHNLCILGGEPLCPANEFLTMLVILEVKKKLPTVPVYIWTGYTIEELLQYGSNHIKDILKNTDYLIDGRYDENLKDLTLKMRGSSNQRIINMKSFDFSENL